MRHMREILLSITAAIILCGCAANEEGIKSPSCVVAYDIKPDGTGLEAKETDVMVSSDDISESVRLLLQRMIEGPAGNRLGAAVPTEVSEVTFTVGAQTASVNFDGAFNDVPKLRRLLCEAAVVRTLCQLEDIYAVSFMVDKTPITDLRGNPIGVLTPDSFAGLDGVSEKTDLLLYFADESGKSLVERVESVTYLEDDAPDRVIVQNLILGPKSLDAFATLDPSTVIDDVMTKNGICYVSLSRDFLNKTTNVSDEVVIYSLVNSLTELGNVNKVQIMIDGKTDAKLGEYDLSQLFERSLDMIE